MKHSHGFMLCPVCFRPADVSAQRFSCSAGHSFDRAKQGYFNLEHNSGVKVRGDTVEQVRYRDKFLSRQHFTPIADFLGEIALKDRRDYVAVLDAGIGSGHYLRHVTGVLETKGCTVSAIGLDVSRACVSFAARKQPDALNAVYDLRRPWPFVTRSLDVIINAFSPHNFRETRRVLKSDGVFLLVFPLLNHFAALRQHYGLMGIEEQKIDRYRLACFDNFSSVIEHRISYSCELEPEACQEAVMMGPNGLGREELVSSDHRLVDFIDVGILECRQPKGLEVGFE